MDYQQSKFYIVDAAALPEIYLRVAEAKRLLETGEEKTVYAATKRTKVSRSAFYKYKDAIRPFQDLRGLTATIQILLRNETGSLSAVLNFLAERGANVLTIHQSIPGGGAAAVTVDIETDGMEVGTDSLVAGLRCMPSVIRCEIIAG